MTGPVQRPLLFLDVDGPLIPFGGTPEQYPPGPTDPTDPSGLEPFDGGANPLLGWAAGRPFAWVDDEVTDTDRAWVAAHHRGHALLHGVDPRNGLTDADYAALDSWLRQPF